MSPSTHPASPDGPSKAPLSGEKSAADGKVVVNVIAAALTTILALWLVWADLSFPGTLLFQDSASLTVLLLFVLGLFLSTLVLAPLPKRLATAACLLALSRASLGWPLSLIIDYNLACPLIDFALLALGLFHGWSALRRSSQQVQNRPWVSGRHSLIAVLLGVMLLILALPTILLGTVHASKDLLGDYVKISWRGVSLVERVFEKDGRRVHLVGMMHIGDGSFYRELSQRMRTPLDGGRRLILTEGVKDSQGLLPEGFKSGETYSNFAKILGLTPQSSVKDLAGSVESTGNSVETPGVEFRNGDIDVSALDEDSLETLVTLMEWLDTGSLATLLTTQPEGVSSYDLERLMRDGLLRQRNDALMAHFSEAETNFEEIYLPWGAAHLTDLEERLRRQGYVQKEETIRPIVRFWE